MIGPALPAGEDHIKLVVANQCIGPGGKIIPTRDPYAPICDDTLSMIDSRSRRMWIPSS